MKKASTQEKNRHLGHWRLLQPWAFYAHTVITVQMGHWKPVQPPHWRSQGLDPPVVSGLDPTAKESRGLLIPRGMQKVKWDLRRLALPQLLLATTKQKTHLSQGIFTAHRWYLNIFRNRNLLHYVLYSVRILPSWGWARCLFEFASKFAGWLLLYIPWLLVCYRNEYAALNACSLRLPK